jgi:hypothetical protein
MVVTTAAAVARAIMVLRNMMISVMSPARALAADRSPDAARRFMGSAFEPCGGGDPPI